MPFFISIWHKFHIRNFDAKSGRSCAIFMAPNTLVSKSVRDDVLHMQLWDTEHSSDRLQFCVISSTSYSEFKVRRHLVRQ